MKSAIISIISIISLFIKNLSKFYKIIGMITLIMSIYSIVNSKSRQGVLVVAFGIVFYICFCAHAYKWKQRFIIFIASFFAASSAIFGMLQQGPLAYLLYKDSVSVRGFYWRAGIEMFLNYPLTGVGLDNYGSFFKEYRESSYPLRYGFTLTSSNAHNTFIQLFSTGGLFVGMSYLFVIISIFVVGIKLVKKVDNDDKKVVLALLSAWVGFQAQSLISIDNIGISVWGWLLGGSILGLSYIIRYEKDGNSRQRRLFL
jgi:O-antigen ligase